MKDDSFDEKASALLQIIRSWLDRQRRGEGKVIHWDTLPELTESLRIHHWLERGGMGVAEFGEFITTYLEGCTRLHHPHFMAHQVAAPAEVSSLADWVNGLTNNGMAIFEMGPPAVALERGVVRWFLDKVGWPAGDGVLTHGGSLGNLTALLAARATLDPEIWQEGLRRPLAVLATETCHYSIARSLSILGVGASGHAVVRSDARGALDPDDLPRTLARVRQAGREPLAVVANGCATATGIYDPIEELAAFCREEGIWLHVDGAHGASALLHPATRPLLQGVEQADSLVWDAHKMLKTSILCAAVLYREARVATAAFSQDASYLAEGQDERYPNLFDRQLECTKNGLGLKLFLVLATHGEEALAELVHSLYRQAVRFHDRIESRGGFTTLCRPQSNILCFRYGENDDLQEWVRQSLICEGSFHVSSTLFGGRRWLRLVLMNELTDLEHLDALLERIEVCAGEYAE